MAEPLENLALRMENDPFFLACPLRLFAQSKGFDDAQLADWLGCSMETLLPLRLCRAPEGRSSRFLKDIGRIAATYQVGEAELADAVRRGQTIWQLRQGQAGGAGMLRAARDGDAGREDDE
jgi:hypothetical protein